MPGYEIKVTQLDNGLIGLDVVKCKTASLETIRKNLLNRFPLENDEAAQKKIKSALMEVNSELNRRARSSDDAIELGTYTGTET